MTATISLVPSSTSLAQGGKEKQLRIVDIPGHPRISKGIFAAHSDRAKGIIVVVDAVEFMAQKDQVHSRCLECQSVWMALDHKVASSQLLLQMPQIASAKQPAVQMQHVSSRIAAGCGAAV